MVRVFGTGPGDLSTPHDVFESDYALKSGEARGSWSHPVPDYVEFAVSPDGRRVYAATQDRVWDHETGQQTRSEFFVIALDAENGTGGAPAGRSLGPAGSVRRWRWRLTDEPYSSYRKACGTSLATRFLSTSASSPPNER